MKIIGSHLQKIVGAYAKQTRKPDSVAGVSQTPVDQVDVSQQAGEILKARQAYDKLPEVREDRVTEIRGKLQGGSYKIDDAKISQAILVGAIREKLLGKDEG